jgi:pyruvate-ferredoxin/flavodoxin oxidoreductase
MQSEGGVAGAVHGSLLGGALTTTFTASQGLLLMVPNLYKIAGELLPFCLHVTARTVATHALSIFGDHSDVMACRATGFTMLCSNNPQEAQDLALVAQAATYEAQIPFLHFFDGFRTSHEIQKIKPLSDDDLRAVISEPAIEAFRRRAQTPDAPRVRGTAQNPDVFFQAREAANSYYQRLPDVLRAVLARFEAVTGRAYHFFEYEGHPEAEEVIVVMGSAAETCAETAAWLNRNGRRTGVLKVRLFLPFLPQEFIKVLPKSTRSIAVLDRTKEPGAMGEPLLMNVLATIAEYAAEFERVPRVVGGRYGLGSKEFTPGMVKAVYENLRATKPLSRFTVGIIDDVTGTSLPWDDSFDLEADDVVRAVFVGLGSDGTVGANKNSIKIIGEETEQFAQAYFVYDSKKSGAMTVSHLRFGPRPIRAPYLINQASFVACSQYTFVGKDDVLRYAAPGAIVLLNSPFTAETSWARLPAEWRSTIRERKLRLFVVDASKVARENGMGGRTNTIMQTCFFALSGVLPRDQAIEKIKAAIEKTYKRKGEEVVRRNWAAVDATLAALYEVQIPADDGALIAPPPSLDRFAKAPTFIETVTAAMLEGHGDALPVSAFPPDGTWPLSTSRWEKRNLADRLPVWNADLCIQCNKCAFVCPHAAIRANFFPKDKLEGAPDGFVSVDFRSPEVKGQAFSIQVAPDDCTGCTLCAQVCPAKDKADPNRKALMMEEKPRDLTEWRKAWDFFRELPRPDIAALRVDVKGSQFREPLFEFSGACAGCGETPYIKLLTQLFGDRVLIANATGCSSIYGGNLPTTPYCTNSEGRGPAWSNSLFEDNAEFGFGLRLAVDDRHDAALRLLKEVAPTLDPELVQGILLANQADDKGVQAQRERVKQLRAVLASRRDSAAQELHRIADYLVRKTVWIVGGDGWAYDIGYGGLDHILATGANVKVLVLDTEVYSNTGGQSSKSTPIGAVAKFASGGKPTAKKDLAMIAMQYGHVYVARVAFGAKDSQTVKAFQEAEAHDGPALIIAYSHCIAHGYNLDQGLNHQKAAVDSGYWPLFRYNPEERNNDHNGVTIDSPAPKVELGSFRESEQRFKVLQSIAPERAKELAERAQDEAQHLFERYSRLTGRG